MMAAATGDTEDPTDHRLPIQSVSNDKRNQVTLATNCESCSPRTY